MVFQEDVIKIAHYYGGLSLGKADILRRAMSGKYRSSNRFNMIKEEFFASAIALGRDPAQVAEVWRQMESFAGYSFNKAHSASLQ
jgi:DNA polymerase III alpha subunit